MPSNATITAAIYTGPLSVNLGDGVTALEGRALLHAARVMLGQATSVADVVGLQSTSAWHTFENGVTVRVARLGGQHIADFVRHPVAELPDPGKYAAFALLPYGGVVVDGYLDSARATSAQDSPSLSVLDRFTPAGSTLVRLAQARAAVELALVDEEDPTRIQELTGELQFLHGTGDHALKVVPYLAVPVPSQWASMYNNPVPPPPGGTAKVYSQYRLIKPTMYSGRMRVAAQLLMGMGRQPPPTKEQQLASRGALNADRVAVDDYRDDTINPERPKEDYFVGSLDYSFLWSKTHGVYKSDGGRYYLVRISADGVWAMRLPVLAMSSWAVPDGAKDYFDDLPLGYDFPATDVRPGEPRSPWDQAVRDGWVKQLVTADDLAPFYDKLSPTYAECGWAFSLSGKKADNVGWRINAPSPHDYPVFEHWSIEIGGGDAGPRSANRYDYDHQYGGYDASIEDMTGIVRVVGKGNAVDVAQYNKPFKVPVIDTDTGIPGVVSFDMLPRGWPASGPPSAAYLKAYPTYPVSDTVVHVFYDEEELVWVRFYNPMNTTGTEGDSWDDRDDPPYCMMLGGFTWGEWSRPTNLPKGFYSNRVDQRKIADTSNTNLQSQGRKTWESPYMGIEYSSPYPPFHWGYEASYNADGEWYGSFDPSYRSRKGSPWTAKRHCFHVHVYGTQVTGQRYSYSCAVPLTDREATFLCERHTFGTKRNVDYQYATMVMQWLYYTYPSWIPDFYGYDTDTRALPGGDWLWWELRDDTVKRLAMSGFFSIDNNYTKEPLQPAQTVLNIASGTHTAPTHLYDNGTTEANVDEYDIVTLCSTTGGVYPHKMKGVAGSNTLWEDKIPSDDGFKVAHFWCTRSVIGNEASKMHIYLNGNMAYTGVRADVLSEFETISPHRQVTFIGET